MKPQTLQQQLDEAHGQATEALAKMKTDKSSAARDEFIKWNKERGRLLEEYYQAL